MIVLHLSLLLGPSGMLLLAGGSVNMPYVYGYELWDLAVLVVACIPVPRGSKVPNSKVPRALSEESKLWLLGRYAVFEFFSHWSA